MDNIKVNEFCKLNNDLYTACKSGDLETVRLMIEKGANNFNEGLNIACDNGDIKIVELMIEHGANNWEYGINKAIELKYMKIVEFLIEKGAKNVGLGKCFECKNVINQKTHI